MQNYELILKCPVSTSFFAEKAKGSVDLSDESKTWHKLKIENIDLDSPWNIGVIYGASGSGKTTIAKHIFGDFDFYEPNKNIAVIDQFPKNFDYDMRAKQLNAIGLSQIPCWIKPLGLLSNGQQERAKIALALANNAGNIFDEWTSVVDRNVAAVMSHTVQKFARKNNKSIILISCHNDVIDWLDPDWIIDCDESVFVDRRMLVGGERKKKMCFSIREVNKNTWHQFSKYHYLSDKNAGGLGFYYGLFIDEKQIGYQAFSEYTPWSDKTKKRILHFNRTVIHPDYVGFGLGMMLINKTSKMIAEKGYIVMGKFSSIPVFKAMNKDKKWRLSNSGFMTAKSGDGMKRKSSFRKKVKWWSFIYIGEAKNVKTTS